MAPDSARLVAAILNDAWMVRHYLRGALHRHNTQQKLRREQAIQKLGLTVRHAFECSNDFEALLAAVVDGLRPQDKPPF